MKKSTEAFLPSEHGPENPPEPTVHSLFETLANPMRLRILTLLGDGELCVCYLFETLQLPQAQVSKQLATLRQMGLVSTRREGKWMHYRATRLPDAFGRLVAEALTLAAKQREHQDDRARLRMIAKNPEAFPAVLDAPKPKLARACCV